MKSAINNRTNRHHALNQNMIYVFINQESKSQNLNIKVTNRLYAH